MFNRPHSHPEPAAGMPSSFSGIDTERLGQAIGALNAIIDAHSALMRQDSAIAQALLRYENLLIDAQGGSTEALKKATSPEEFDPILDMAENTTHPAYGQLQMEYRDFRADLLRFRGQYLGAGTA